MDLNFESNNVLFMSGKDAVRAGKGQYGLESTIASRRAGTFGARGGSLQFGFAGSTGRKPGLDQVLKGNNPFDVSTSAADHSGGGGQ